MLLDILLCGYMCNYQQHDFSFPQMFCHSILAWWNCPGSSVCCCEGNCKKGGMKLQRASDTFPNTSKSSSANDTPTSSGEIIKWGARKNIVFSLAPWPCCLSSLYSPMPFSSSSYNTITITSAVIKVFSLLLNHSSSESILCTFFPPTCRFSPAHLLRSQLWSPLLSSFTL